MSRLFRGARTFIPPRLSTRIANGQEVVFHQVKVKRKKYGSGYSRLMLRLSAAYLAFSVFNHFVFQPLAKGVEDAEASGVLAAIEEDEDEKDDDIFIPFPLTTKRVTPQPYAARDPEWQEFIRISRDVELQRRMRHSLVGRVLRAASQPHFSSTFGKPTKVSRFWLDLDYPLYPPPEFQQTGLLINKEVIAIAVRERDPLPAQLEERILWPKPLALAAWASFKTTVGQSTELIRKALFGIDPADQPGKPPAGASPAIAAATTEASDVQKSIQALRQQATRRPEEVPGAAPNANSSSMAPAGTGKQAPVKPSPSDPSSSPNRSSGASSSSSTTGGKTVQTSKEPSPALKAFMEKYRRTYSSFRRYPPRGCVPVTGTVEVETSHYWVYVDVFAWYNPKTKDYDHDSLAMGVKRYRQRRKSPLR